MVERNNEQGQNPQANELRIAAPRDRFTRPRTCCEHACQHRPTPSHTPRVEQHVSAQRRGHTRDERKHLDPLVASKQPFG